MSENLHDLLERDDPVALRRIEKALDDTDGSNEDVEAIVTALIWRRCTTGQNGVLGAVLHRDCAERIGVLADHLEQVGATDAAQVMRDLRERIPLRDEQIRHGLIDWVDSNPAFASYAKGLDAGVEDIGPTVWTFMQDRQDDLPDPEIPDKSRGLFARMFGE